MTRDSLQLDVQQLDEATVVRLRGAAGMYDAERLQDRLEQLTEADPGQMVLDLTELAFISSQGLGALVAVQSRRRRQGRPLKLVRPQPPVRQVLEMTRLTQLFPIYDSTQAALAQT